MLIYYIICSCACKISFMHVVLSYSIVMLLLKGSLNLSFMVICLDPPNIPAEDGPFVNQDSSRRH